METWTRKFTWINRRASRYQARSLRCATSRKHYTYSLKQAGRQWHTHLHSTLEGLGFQKNISSDVLIFIKCHHRGDPLIMLVYVNDITLFSTLDDIQAFKMQIAMHYKVTDLGEVSHFLRLHNTHDHLKKTLTPSTRRITSRECLHGSTCRTATP